MTGFIDWNFCFSWWLRLSHDTPDAFRHFNQPVNYYLLRLSLFLHWDLLSFPGIRIGLFVTSSPTIVISSLTKASIADKRRLYRIFVLKLVLFWCVGNSNFWRFSFSFCICFFVCLGVIVCQIVCLDLQNYSLFLALIPIRFPLCHGWGGLAILSPSSSNSLPLKQFCQVSSGNLPWWL